MNTRAFYLRGSMLALVLVLSGCNDVGPEQQGYSPVAFHAGDECHICGMAITQHPGPKGEAVDKQGALKFCSTAEMLNWWLQPENKGRQVSLYVHDMARGTWEAPDDSALTDATKAFYVVGSNLKGAMGASLASFAKEEDAKEFVVKEGGRLVRFEEIDLVLLQPQEAHQPGLHTGKKTH